MIQEFHWPYSNTQYYLRKNNGMSYSLRAFLQLPKHDVYVTLKKGYDY
jgi:hypothetical protein